MTVNEALFFFWISITVFSKPSIVVISFDVCPLITAEKLALSNTVFGGKISDALTFTPNSELFSISIKTKVGFSKWL